MHAVVWWTTIAIVACVGAVLSHLAIDGAANFVVAHDPMDDVEHASRATLVLGVAAMLAGVVACMLVSAWSDVASRESLLAGVMHEVGRSNPWLLAARIAPICFGLVAAMEAADSAAAGVRVDDVAALFGGSVPLGVVIVACTALCGAFAARAVLDRCARTLRVIVSAVRALRISAKQPALGRLRRPMHLLRLGPIPPLAAHSGKRAPPRLAA